MKCTIFSVIIIFSATPNDWCLSGNQPKIYIAKDKQIVLLGHMISNPKFWGSIDVSGIKDVVRVKIENWDQETRGIKKRGYPTNCNTQNFISPTNFGILALVVLFAIAATGIISNYFHRYSLVRTSLQENGDFPMPERENDIEINILRKKESYHLSTDYQLKFSPIHFESKSIRLPIERENILDVSNNEESEEVKVVNNIVYLED